MSAEVFLDTNILIYLFDETDARKNQRCGRSRAPGAGDRGRLHQPSGGAGDASTIIPVSVRSAWARLKPSMQLVAGSTQKKSRPAGASSDAEVATWPYGSAAMSRP